MSEAPEPFAMKAPTIVIIESPYAGDVAANVDYARAACRDSYERGEVPFASHLFYTQFMDDRDPVERMAGIECGYAMWWNATKIVFYIDRGWSAGMQAALRRVKALTSHEVEYRCLKVIEGTENVRIDPRKNEVSE